MSSTTMKTNLQKLCSDSQPPWLCSPGKNEPEGVPKSVLTSSEQICFQIHALEHHGSSCTGQRVTVHTSPPWVSMLRLFTTFSMPVLPGNGTPCQLLVLTSNRLAGPVLQLGHSMLQVHSVWSCTISAPLCTKSPFEKFSQSFQHLKA